MACQGNLPLPFSDASRLIGHESKAKFLVTHHYTTKNEAEKEDDNALANLDLGAKQVRKGCRQMEKGSFALHPCRNGPLHLPFLTSLTGN